MSTINLLPEDYQQRRSQHRANVICMMLFGIVISSVGGAALVSERAGQNTRAVCERINTSYAEAAKLIDEMHHLEAKKRKMLQKAELSAALMERLPRSYVLAMVTNALPEGASLTSLKMSAAASMGGPKPRTKHARIVRQRGAAKSAARTVAVSLVLDGEAATDVQVARFIANLAKNPLTELVDLAYSRETQKKDGVVRRFRLTVRLMPNADALDGMPRRREQAAKAQEAPEVAMGGGA